MKKVIVTILASLLSLIACAQVRVLWDQPISLDAPGYAAVSLHLDSQGNPYLGGSWNQGYNDQGHLVVEYLVMKYRPDGARSWFKRHGTQTRTDAAYAFALDHHDNPIITGVDQAGQTTLKYDPEGTLLWTRSTQFGFPELLTVDPQDNIFVIGDGALQPSKYAPDGTLLWHQTYSAGTGAVRTLTDAQGNLFVLATTGTATTVYDVLLLKYSPAGDLLWSWIYDGPAHGWDQARDMALDAQGNVIITANSDQVLNPLGPGIAAMVTWKFDTDGQVLWENRFYAPNKPSLPVALAIEPQTNAVYLLGGPITYNHVTYSFDPLLIKYNADGTQAWVKPISLPAADEQDLVRLRLAPEGVVYVLGYVAAIAQSPDGAYYADGQTVLCKFDREGQQHWDYEFGSGKSYYELVFDGVRIYLIGYESVPPPTNFLAHLLRAQIQAVRSEGDVSGPTGQADGVVDDWDITALILAFGSTDSAFDVNGDGRVDETDLAIAIKNFGTGADD